MTPIVKEYTNDGNLEKDINTLKEQNIAVKDIYVLSHDPDRTERIVGNTEASGIDYNQSESNASSKKPGDELRNKLKSLGVTENDADGYEEDMDEGKVLLIVTDEKANQVL